MSFATLHREDEWIRIKGRGWVAMCKSDREYDRDKPELTGQIVTIDDEDFLCVGVERFLGRPRSIQPGEEIGLLVKQVDGSLK